MIENIFAELEGQAGLDSVTTHALRSGSNTPHLTHKPLNSTM